ncbi:hypothetical protein X943_002692 [Babesia divergens]|uniref:Uncharacterized protein n=1 Tax=Babesia divergens TaxID=32595 RepID=A0AAD9LJD2_BABDI|nr:hypothetical protein X943_002692 [Babesia divergens]
MATPSPTTTSVPEDEKVEESYASMLNRYIHKIIPSPILSKAPIISKCCDSGSHDDTALEDSVTSFSTAEADEKYEEAAEQPLPPPDESSAKETAAEEPEHEMKRVVVRSVEVKEDHDGVPSIDIGTREVSFKKSTVGMKSMDSRSLSFHDEQRDPEITERAMLIFIENSISLAKRAVAYNKAILADKLICDMLKRIRDVYGVNEKDYVEDTKTHPFIHMMDKLPKDTPTAVREAVATIADDKLFISSLVEKILILDLIDTFNMTALKTHMQNYRQRFLARLWPSAIETAQYEMMHPQASAIMDNEVNGDFIQKEEDTEQEVIPVVVQRTAPKRGTVSEEKKHFRKSSRYFAYASKILSSRKNTMFGQHFSKNKVKTADGWVKEPYRTLETYYRFEDNGSVSVKVRGKLHSDTMQVLCIINETDLSSEWVPFLKEATNLHVFSRTTKIFQQQYEYPVIGAKTTSVFGVAVNALDESGCFILGCRGPPETEADVKKLTKVLQDGGLEDTAPFVSYEGNKCKLWGQEMQPIQSKIRQTSADLCFLLYPMEQHTLVELYANITPEVRLVPTRVVTYIIKKVVVTLFKRIAQISNNFNESPFAERMQQNADFYSWIATLLEDYQGKGERQNCNISICTYDTNCNDP